MKSTKTLNVQQKHLKTQRAQIKREHIFREAKPWKAIFKMILPTIIAQLIIASYHVIDKIIATNFGIEYVINNYHHMGAIDTNIAKTIINVATGYAGVVSAMTFAFSLLVSIGTSIKASIAMGQKNEQLIKDNVGTGIILSLGMSIILSITMWFLALPIIEFQTSLKTDGTEWEKQIIIQEALNYSRVTIGGIILLFGANFWIMLFRSEGRIVAIICINVTACLINIGLDFAFVFNFGMVGTAYATLVAWFFYIISALFIIYYSESHFKIRWKHLKFKPRLALGILALGFASLLENIAQALIIMTTARLLHNLPTPNFPNEGISIYVSLSAGIAPWLVILTAPIIGLGYGARALVGYAYGQRNFKRIWNYMARLFILLFCILTFLVLIVTIFGQNMLIIFGVDPAVAEQFKIYIVMQFAFYPLATFSYMAIILFQSTNHPKLALFSSMQRTIVMPAICLTLGFFVANWLNEGFYYYLFIGFIDLLASLILIPVLIITIYKNRRYVFKTK